MMGRKNGSGEKLINKTEDNKDNNKKNNRKKTIKLKITEATTNNENKNNRNNKNTMIERRRMICQWLELQLPLEWVEWWEGIYLNMCSCVCVCVCVCV